MTNKHKNVILSYSKEDDNGKKIVIYSVNSDMRFNMYHLQLA